MKTCKFDGCDLSVKAKGYCTGHYQQFNKGLELRPLNKNVRREGPHCRMSGCNRPAMVTGERCKPCQKAALRTSRPVVVSGSSRHSTNPNTTQAAFVYNDSPMGVSFSEKDGLELMKALMSSTPKKN